MVTIYLFLVTLETLDGGKFMRILYSSIVAMLITDFYIMIVMSPSSCLARR